MRAVLFFLLIVAGLAASAPAPAVAQPIVQAEERNYANASDVPLVVIRFNQRRVFFEKPLYNAVSKAIAIKPGTIFEVVSFVPQASSSGGQERVDANAASQQAQVVNTLRQIGIPRQQIRTSRDIAPDAQFHEIYVYVE